MTASEQPTPAPPSSDAATTKPSQDTASSPAEASQVAITQGQAEEILAELKVVKQRLLWVLVIVGFFAARALFFHY